VDKEYTKAGIAVRSSMIDSKTKSHKSMVHINFYFLGIKPEVDKTTILMHLKSRVPLTRVISSCDNTKIPAVYFFSTPFTHSLCQKNWVGKKFCISFCNIFPTCQLTLLLSHLD
jgi:hypothetical protein